MTAKGAAHANATDGLPPNVHPITIRVPSGVVHRPVPLNPEETISVKEAAYMACASADTIPRWARRYGIGWQAGPRANWRISKPALAMLLAGDHAALTAYRNGDRHSESVLRYYDVSDCKRPTR